MTKAIKHDGWACGDCGKIHRHHSDAIECCAEMPQKGTDWSCWGCGMLYDTFQEAEGCCLPEDEAEIILNTPTPEELEAAGQMRLLP